MSPLMQKVKIEFKYCLCGCGLRLLPRSDGSYGKYYKNHQDHYCFCHCGAKTEKLSDGSYKRYYKDHEYLDNIDLEDWTEALGIEKVETDKANLGDPWLFRSMHVDYSIKPGKELLRVLRCEDELSVSDLAIRFGKSTRTIQKWLSQYEILHDSFVNKNFFKSWTPEMAWVLGLLFTDGYLSSRSSTGVASIILSQKDPEILIKTKKLLRVRAKINKVKNGPNNFIHNLAISYKYFIDDVQRIGLTTNKSLTMRFPDMPMHIQRHFIRGCWDGDGGFSSTDTGSIAAHFTTGSENFIEELARILFRDGLGRSIPRGTLDTKRLLRTIYKLGPYPLSIYKQKNSNAFRLTLTGKNSLLRLGRYFYKDTDDSILYSPKRKKLIELIRN